MKAYLAHLAGDFQKAQDDGVSEEALKKVTGKLVAAAHCAWCYNDDLEFWKDHPPLPHPKDWPYQGFIIPFPDKDGRGELQPEDCCLVAMDYPMEKVNPEVDWGTLKQCIENPALHRFYIFANIVIA